MFDTCALLCDNQEKDYTLAFIQDFFQGGGGSCPMARKQPGQRFFFCVCVFSLQLILQYTEGIQWFYYIENYIFPKDQEGIQHFPGGGVQLFSGGGVQMLISIETHIICDFWGEGGCADPYNPSVSAHATLKQNFPIHFSLILACYLALGLILSTGYVAHLHSDIEIERRV